MGLYTSLPEGTEEARKVDFFVDIALEAITSFFKNATNSDVLDALDGAEDKWPAERLAALINLRTERVERESAQDEMRQQPHQVGDRF
jgi:hypothetical protein